MGNMAQPHERENTRVEILRGLVLLIHRNVLIALKSFDLQRLAVGFPTAELRHRINISHILPPRKRYSSYYYYSSSITSRRPASWAVNDKCPIATNSPNASVGKHHWKKCCLYLGNPKNPWNHKNPKNFKNPKNGGPDPAASTYRPRGCEGRSSLQLKVDFWWTILLDFAQDVAFKG